MRFEHSCFPINIATLLRTPIKHLRMTAFAEKWHRKMNAFANHNSHGKYVDILQCQIATTNSHDKLPIYTLVILQTDVVFRLSFKKNIHHLKNLIVKLHVFIVEN